MQPFDCVSVRACMYVCMSFQFEPPFVLCSNLINFNYELKLKPWFMVKVIVISLLRVCVIIQDTNFLNLI